MSYRALFTGDIHSSNALPYAKRGEDLVTDRLRDTLDVLVLMNNYAAEHRIKDIWILGDLIDRRLLDAVTLKVVMFQLLDLVRNGFKVRLIPGNHEAHDAECRHYTLDAFVALKGIEVFPGRMLTDIFVPDGPLFTCLPYCPEEEARVLLRKHKPGGIALLHHTIAGGRVGPWICPDGLTEEDLAQFSHVLSGHFHTPQTFSRVNYLGAPIQHNFGDTGEVRGFWDLTINEDSTVTGDLVPCAFAPMFIESDEYCDGTPVFPEADKGDYVRIRLHGTPTQIKHVKPDFDAHCARLISERGARMAKVEPVPMTEAKVRLDFTTSGGTEARSWASIVGRYIDACDVSGLNAERLRTLGERLIREGSE